MSIFILKYIHCMETVFNWENLMINKEFEDLTNTRLLKFDEKGFLTKFLLNITKGNNNSRFTIKLTAWTINIGETISVSGTCFNLEYTLNDVISELNIKLKTYDEQAFNKRKLLEEGWQQKALENRAIRDQEKARDNEIIQENIRRSKINQDIRRKNEIEKITRRVQKDIMKKLHKQKIIDEVTRYEYEKDRLEKERILEEKRLLHEARLMNVARIQKETIAHDLGLEIVYKEEKSKLVEIKEDNNEATKIKNKIIKIETKDFDEIFPPNEPFQNESTGEWYYHDGEGNYYYTNKENEWVEDTQTILDNLNLIKEEKVKELFIQKESIEKRQDSITNEEYLNDKNLPINVKGLEKIDKDLNATEKKLSQLIESKENKIANLKETHEINVTWLEPSDNKYYYHDGNNNYFTTNSSNEWIDTKNPQVILIENEYEKAKSKLNSYKEKDSSSQIKVSNKPKETKILSDDKTIPKPNESYQYKGKSYYFDSDDKYYTVNDKNEWIETTNPHIQPVETIEDNYENITNEPFQDENGLWWYIDQDKQYFYLDQDNNWIKFES